MSNTTPPPGRFLCRSGKTTEIVIIRRQVSPQIGHLPPTYEVVRERDGVALYKARRLAELEPLPEGKTVRIRIEVISDSGRRRTLDTRAREETTAELLRVLKKGGLGVVGANVRWVDA